MPATLIPRKRRKRQRPSLPLAAGAIGATAATVGPTMAGVGAGAGAIMISIWERRSPHVCDGLFGAAP
jgi:hypothetical protein